MTREFSLAERTFASGDVIPTAEQSYRDGFVNGFHWPDRWNYHPGGPFYTTYHNRYSNSETDHYRRCLIWSRASKQAHDEWHRGWTDGNRSKDEIRKCGIVLPSWDSVEEFRRAVDREEKKDG